MALDIADVRQGIERGDHMFWIPTEKMPADYLTKWIPDTEVLADLLRGREFRLRYTREKDGPSSKKKKNVDSDDDDCD